MLHCIFDLDMLLVSLVFELFQYPLIVLVLTRPKYKVY